MGRLLIVGLGNPGPSYADQRHNVGFRVVEEVARRAGESLSQKKFLGRFCTARVGSRPTILLLPETWMNLSGRSVARAAGFYGVSPEDVLVVHDEMDIALGRLKLMAGGGHGGHNGVKSVIAELGSSETLRLRVGVGRPPRGDATSFVLSPFSADEQRSLPALLERAADAVELVARDGISKAASVFNGANKQSGE